MMDSLSKPCTCCVKIRKVACIRVFELTCVVTELDRVDGIHIKAKEL